MMQIGGHQVDETDIDELDEISGEQRLMLVWCKIHHAWEWHWLPREVLVQ